MLLSSDGTCRLDNTKKFSFTGKLNTVGKIEKLPDFRYRWNTNEEVFIILTSFQEHDKWTSSEVKIRPPNGSLLLYNRENIKTRAYHNDKYYWKTRKNSKSSRVDHSSLRIKGVECIYCSYVHSALVPTFHRRCYWLLENPDIVLVHYLNLPDKNSHDNLVISLLPYKDMHKQELLNQLQPILSDSGDKEDNNKKIANINIDELISEVKCHKEPKANSNTGNKKMLGTEMMASKLHHPVPSKDTPQAFGDSEKCSNCNRHLTTRREMNFQDTARLLSTNVAVTINRPNSPQHQVEESTINKQNNTTTRKPTPKTFDFQANFSPAKISSDLANGSIQPTGSSLEQFTTTSWKGDLNGNVEHSAVPASGYCNLNTLSEAMTTNRSLQSASLTREELAARQVKGPNNDLMCSSVTGLTEARAARSANDKPCRTNGQHLVLDYDGLDLIQSNSSDEDVTKALDMSLFDGDLMDYLPDYLSDVNKLPPSDACADVVSVTFPTLRDPSSTSGVPRATSSGPMVPSSSSNLLILNPTSSNYCNSSNQHVQRFQTLTSDSVNGSLSPSPFTETISTNCHTFGLLVPGPLQAPATGGSLTVNTHQCSSQAPVTFLAAPQTSNSASLLQEHHHADRAQFCGTGYRLETSPLPEGIGDKCVDRITEFSPEWSYCKGKTKILVLGDWSQRDGSYSCLFDGCGVPASLIQSGVLRCFCPPHDVALVVLQVAWNGAIVSDTCVFEYRARESATVQDWLSVSDVELKQLVVERMEKLEATLAIGAEDDLGSSGISVEDRIIRICEVLFNKPSSGSDWVDSSSKGLSLLHLSAALGLTKLIQSLRYHALTRQTIEMHVDDVMLPAVTSGGDVMLPVMTSGGDVMLPVMTSGGDVMLPTATSGGDVMLHTVTSGGDVILPVPECAPLNKDSFGCTPLMWACWRGHQESALALLAWEPSSYDDCDSRGRSAKAMAEEMGHLELARKMEGFICSKNNRLSMSDGSLSLPTPPYPPVPFINQASPEHCMDDVEMTSGTNEDRPNSLGKVLVEIRTLIQEAELRSRSSQSPLQSPEDTTPFSVAFGGFSEDKDPNDQRYAESRVVPRTSHYDTLSVDSNSPSHTPCSLSPGSPSLHSSPQSTSTDTSEFEEFLSKPRKFLERDFSELTLTDIEQQELLHAAKVIQNAYRQFKIRKKQHIDELNASILIQSYYRRYKQFATYKKITKAAVLIQNSYRAHREHEQFKKSRQAAAIIQNCFRHYRKRKQKHAEEDPVGKRLGTKYRKPSHGK